MNYSRILSRTLVSVMTFLTVLCACVMLGGDKVSSDTGRNSYYTREYLEQVEKQKLLDAGFYDVKIAEVSTTTTTTTTDTEETTTTSTTESTTMTSVTTTTTDTSATKKSTTSKATTTKKKTKSTTTTTTSVETESTPQTQSSNNLPITNSEFIMLANLVAHEYGANWVATKEKAKVVATVMNRVRDKRFPNTIKAVILQKNQYCWVPDSYYWKRTTQGCKDAVTYYFTHQSEFSTKINSFVGNGRTNRFYSV